jgi:16S rRNA (cytidine1402-2'-O)-methyltransferase
MASGLGGQNFAFIGYLPVAERERRQAIRTLERKAAEGQTQVFIEAPYRNNQMMASLLRYCQQDTVLSVASELTLPGEFILTQNIAEWKKQLPNLNKKPTVFLIGR